MKRTPLEITKVVSSVLRAFGCGGLLGVLGSSGVDPAYGQEYRTGSWGGFGIVGFESCVVLMRLQQLGYS